MKSKETNKKKNVIGNQKEKVKTNNNLMLITTLLMLIIAFLFVMIFLNKNHHNSEKIGNNMSIKEIEKTILNINSYKAEIDVTIKSNKNENRYKLYQEVKDGREIQKVIEPESLKGAEIIYENGNLQIKNAQINASKIYTNYPYIANNELFLNDFLKNFNESSNKEIKREENKIIFKLKNGRIYNQEQILTIEKNNYFNKDIDNTSNNKDIDYTNNNINYINKDNIKDNSNQNNNGNIKMTMQIIDSNSNVRIYIIYNKIEFNI